METGRARTLRINNLLKEKLPEESNTWDDVPNEKDRKAKMRNHAFPMTAKSIGFWLSCLPQF